MAKPALPNPSSEAYLWWSQGAADNEATHTEGLSLAALQLREALEAYARLSSGKTLSAADLATFLVKLWAPERLRRRYRD